MKNSAIGPWRCVFLLASLLATAGCANSSSPTPTGPTPASATAPAPGAAPTAAFALIVDSLGSQEALTGVSDITVDASQSTGSGLRYLVEFGDGSAATEPVARHRYDAAGTYQVKVTLTDATGRTDTTSRQLVVGSPLGAWLYSGYFARIRWVEVRTLRLTEQSGATVRGVLSRARERDSAVTGTLTPDRRIRLTVDGSPETLEGVVPSTLTGDDTVWTLTARGGPADGETLAFTRRVGEPSGPPPDAVLKMRFFSFSAPWAVKEISPVLFDGSTSRGDGLKFFIEFGDGQSTTAATATHPISEVGNYAARLTVVDRFGRSDFETNDFRVRTLVADSWDVHWFGLGTRLTIKSQSGTNISGNVYYIETETPTPFTGTADASGNVRLRLDGGVTLAGTLAYGMPNYYFRMVLQYEGGPRNGQTLTLDFRDGY